jgi:O-6-methylguanine DNA methyltransferase
MVLRVLNVPPSEVICGIGRLPAGDVVVGVTPEGELCRVSFLHSHEAGEIIDIWQREWQGTRFITGKIPKNFNKLPMIMSGTPLQGRVWQQILQLNKGEVASYGQIADLIDMPGRARAVGKACWDCTISYLVPCHRVIGAAGLGGYGREGTEFKEELLRAEGIVLRPGKRISRG